jgi:hypothetical protein
MRGIADQSHARRGKAVGEAQRQRIGEPIPRQRDLAQKIAKAGPQRLQILVIRQRLDRLRGGGFPPELAVRVVEVTVYEFPDQPIAKTAT